MLLLRPPGLLPPAPTLRLITPMLRLMLFQVRPPRSAFILAVVPAAAVVPLVRPPSTPLAWDLAAFPAPTVNTLLLSPTNGWMRSPTATRTAIPTVERRLSSAVVASQSSALSLIRALVVLRVTLTCLLPPSTLLVNPLRVLSPSRTSGLTRSIIRGDWFCLTGTGATCL